MAHDDGKDIIFITQSPFEMHSETFLAYAWTYSACMCTCVWKHMCICTHACGDMKLMFVFFLYHTLFHKSIVSLWTQNIQLNSLTGCLTVGITCLCFLSFKTQVAATPTQVLWEIWEAKLQFLHLHGKNFIHWVGFPISYWFSWC